MIEDVEPIQAVVEGALANASFEPTIVPSGEEAVTLLKEVPGEYRVLMTDINLRGIDGWELNQRGRIGAEGVIRHRGDLDGGSRSALRTSRHETRAACETYDGFGSHSEVESHSRRVRSTPMNGNRQIDSIGPFRAMS